MNDNRKGWFTAAAILLALGLVGDPVHAREVVCTPVVGDPQPGDDTRKTPVVYSF